MESLPEDLQIKLTRITHSDSSQIDYSKSVKSSENI